MVMQISRGVSKDPIRIVVYGPEKIGKTTFGKFFPDPLWMDTEKSTARMDVSRTPDPTSFAMMLAMIGDLRREGNMGFKTLIVDTADWAERLCIAELCSEHESGKIKGIEDFGYGKGYTYLREKFAKLLDALTDLQHVGMNVVMMAHAAMRKQELPNEFGAFDRWELKMSKQVSPLVKEWADALFFLNYETIVVEDEKTKSKKAQGGRRYMYTVHNTCWDAGNRFSLPERIPFDVDPKTGIHPAWEAIKHIFSFTSTQPAHPSATPPTPQAKPVQELVAQTPATAPSTPPSGALAQLGDLMRQSDITYPQIQKLIAAKKWFPADTPAQALPEDFVSGCLIAGWQNVVEFVKSNTL